MAKHSSHILDMARKGAEHKYDELKAEIAGLVKNFPHLAARKGEQISRGASSVLTRGRQALMSAISSDAPKKRRKMSAKARKAISLAQKARWANQKKAALSGATKAATKKS